MVSTRSYGLAPGGIVDVQRFPELRVLFALPVQPGQSAGSAPDLGAKMGLR